MPPKYTHKRAPVRSRAGSAKRARLEDGQHHQHDDEDVSPHNADLSPADPPDLEALFSSPPGAIENQLEHGEGMEAERMVDLMGESPATPEDSAGAQLESVGGDAGAENPVGPPVQMVAADNAERRLDAGEEPPPITIKINTRRENVLVLIDAAAETLPEEMHPFFVRAFAVAKFIGPQLLAKCSRNLMGNDLATALALASLDLQWRVHPAGMYLRRADGVDAWELRSPDQEDAPDMKDRVTLWDDKAAETLTFLVATFQSITTKAWQQEAEDEVADYLKTLGPRTTKAATEAERLTLIDEEILKGTKILTEKTEAYGYNMSKVGKSGIW